MDFDIFEIDDDFKEKMKICASRNIANRLQYEKEKQEEEKKIMELNVANVKKIIIEKLTEFKCRNSCEARRVVETATAGDIEFAEGGYDSLYDWLSDQRTLRFYVSDMRVFVKPLANEIVICVKNVLSEKGIQVSARYFDCSNLRERTFREKLVEIIEAGNKAEETFVMPDIDAEQEKGNVYINDKGQFKKVC